MKKLLSLLFTAVLSLGLLATPAFAAATKEVELLTEPVTLTYAVGDAFQAKEISFRVTYSDGKTADIPHSKLKFTANGTSVKQGYAFKEAGSKKVVVTYGDYEYKYNITVKAKGGKTLKSIALDKTPKTTQYKVGQAFKADEVVLHCTYTDGTTEKVPGSKAKIYANGNPIKNGYKFIQAGPKSVSIQYDNQKTSYKLQVVPNITKKVQDVELLTELKTLNYKVGGAFKGKELTVRCYYTDGTYEDFDHYSIEVYTKDGVELMDGYKFKQRGTKYITVSFLDYKTEYTLKVS